MEEPPRRFKLSTKGLMALIMVFAGVFAAMSGKMFDLRWLIFAGTFIMLTGACLLLVVAFIYDTRPRKRKPVSLPQPPTLSPADTTNKLQPIGDDVFVPSITEKTTDLLKTPMRRK
jgi:hypothetical protein